MSNKKRAALVALVVAVLAAIGFGIASSSVVGAHGGLTTFSASQDLGDGFTGVDTSTENQTITLDRGTMKLVAYGTSTKTLVNDGIGCGNVFMSWDDSPPGASYWVTKRTSWWANHCNEFVSSDLDMRWWTPSGDLSTFNNVAYGETKVSSIDDLGSLTTKFHWQFFSSDRGATFNKCAYLVPGGGGYWTNGTCA